LFNDLLSQQEDNESSWNPLGGRRPSLGSSQLPHPSEVHRFNNEYTFPPTNTTGTIRRNSYHNLFHSQEPVSMLPEVTEVPFYRQQRSMSYSFGQPTQQEDDQDDQDLFYSTNHHHLFLDTIMQEEEEEEEDTVQFERIRSKSSSVMMNDIWHPTSSLDNNRRRSSLIPPPPPIYNNEVNELRERMRRFSLAPISSSLLER
jgi:hypothetical protein